MHNQPRLVLIAVVFIAIVALGSFALHGHLTRWVADHTGPLLAPLSGQLVRARAYIATAASRRDLVRENLDLRAELERVRSESAGADEIRQENAFLRAAARLGELIGTQPLEAGIFSYLRDGGVYEVVVNKGSGDGVALGDVVITAGGSLVGRVLELSDRHAVVRTIEDPTLQVTARIVGTDVSGLVRLDAVQGLILDLVKKSETVTEGQVVATSGNDRFPAGLVIGTVRSVDTDGTTLFKMVRIAPALPDAVTGKVLIIRP